jgi:phosphoglycolate phosphatase
MNSHRRFAARAVIIDLDGTLLDTAADLAAAVNAMLLELGRSPLALSDATRFIGKGAEVLVHRALTGRLDGRVESHELSPALKAFHRHYARENGLRSQLYPGVLEGLSAMRAKGLRLACVTNKPQGFSDVLLERCALSGYFDLVVGGDALARKKPDPLPMLHVCQCFGVSAAEVVAIGDSINDALAARAAGMSVLAVPYGYNEGADVATLDVDAIVPTLEAASALIDAL